MKRAFFSVTDKAGVEDFAQGLLDLGYELVSTGGTQAVLEAAGLPVLNVSEVTGFPECLDGRVKTLHPGIHAGLLAIRDNPQHMRQLEALAINTIDIVVVNLYPFKNTILKPDCTYEDAIENIDIGGPSMLRAAAKNHRFVTVICDRKDYDKVLREIEQTGDTTLDTRKQLCAKVFAHTAAYDAMISRYLSNQNGYDVLSDDTFTCTFERVQRLRYGENPHQRATYFKEIGHFPSALHEAEQLHGKELSYNNISDTNGALELLSEFTGQTAAVAVKHANPCGVGVADTLAEAFDKALKADPVSIYGGIVALSAVVDEAAAKALGSLFLEIIVAPDFSPDALTILTKKKNIRLLKLPGIMTPPPANMLEMKKVRGGLLVQTPDFTLLEDIECKVVTKEQPTPRQVEDAMMAFKVVKHVKSNAIAICRDGQTLGIGPGQVNRVWAATQAIERSGNRVRGAAMASDAYFPFPDSVEAAAKAGISCIIQPGGSIRDQESVDMCDQYGIAMLFTGMRHFKH